MSLQKIQWEAISHYTNRHLALSAKITGTKEDKGSIMTLTKVGEKACLEMK